MPQSYIQQDFHSLTHNHLFCLLPWPFQHIQQASHGGAKFKIHDDIDGLVQERRNSSALAMELRLSCTNPLTWKCFCITGLLWGQSTFGQWLVSPHKRPVTHSLDVFFVVSLSSCLTNSQVVSDLRCHDAHVIPVYLYSYNVLFHLYKYNYSVLRVMKPLGKGPFQYTD